MCHNFVSNCYFSCHIQESPKLSFFKKHQPNLSHLKNLAPLSLLPFLLEIMIRFQGLICKWIFATKCMMTCKVPLPGV